eukprot:9778855-Ditylum_brightwellii.AAC.2
MQNPITMLNIQQHQFQDLPLNQLQSCNHVNDPEKLWRIALPTVLVQPVVAWYHFMLGHCGTNILYDTICARFRAPGLQCMCEEFKCKECQKNMQLGMGYGELPAWVALPVPWSEVAVNLIGPWRIIIGNKEVEFYVLTCIDPVTNLVEMICIKNKTAEYVAQQFKNVWLLHYPLSREMHTQQGRRIHWWHFPANVAMSRDT